MKNKTTAELFTIVDQIVFDIDMLINTVLDDRLVGSMFLYFLRRIKYFIINIKVNIRLCFKLRLLKKAINFIIIDTANFDIKEINGIIAELSTGHFYVWRDFKYLLSYKKYRFLEKPFKKYLNLIQILDKILDDYVDETSNRLLTITTGSILQMKRFEENSKIAFQELNNL